MATNLPRRRIVVLSEDVCGAPDEGVKKSVLALTAALARDHDVELITTGPGAGPAVCHAPAPRTFLSRRLRATLARRRPELLVYVPRSSTTFASFMRAAVLRRFCPGATLVVVGMQVRWHGPLQRRLIGRLAPDLVCVQSSASKRYLESLGCAVALLPSGVDLDRFTPASPDERNALRARHGVRTDLPLVLHVGHLKRGRGVGVLADLARGGGTQVALVVSSSTARDLGLGRELSDAGVRVIADYQPNVEHFYQMADCYVFPVASTDDAIEAPLSVLEACACDLPVVTTRFGGLPPLLGEHPGVAYVDCAEALVGEVRRMCGMGPADTRRLVEGSTWGAIGARLVDEALARAEVLGA